MLNVNRVSVVTVLTAALTGLFAVAVTFAQYASAGPSLTGIVTSSDGKPLEGVTVSIRGEGKTYVTTVFTDQQGVYLTPRLDQGQVKLWAQAVGFSSARANLTVGRGESSRWNRSSSYR